MRYWVATEESEMTEEQIWQSDFEWISQEMGSRIAKRRIRKLSFIHNGKLLVAEVGQPNPYNNIPIRRIYEDSLRGCYLLCAGSITIAPGTSLVEEY